MKPKTKVACKRCIKAYNLPKKVLGKNKQQCYWCLSKIIED